MTFGYKWGTQQSNQQQQIAGRNTWGTRQSSVMQRGMTQQITAQRGMAQRSAVQQSTAQQNTMQRSQTQQQQQQQSPPASLPDGVFYQPLDEKTINMVGSIAPNHPAVAAYRNNQAQAAQSPSALPQMLPLNDEGTLNKPSAPEFPAIPKLPLPELRIVDQLEALMQSERNGAAFYRDLAKIAQTNAKADILRRIGEGCDERTHSYNALYRKYKAMDFETVEHELMGAKSLRQGVELAMTEENSAIKDLIKLYESATDVETRHVLSVQIHRKSSDLSLLHILL